MGKKDKLLQRFLSYPADFSWDELATLLGRLGFELLAGSGSRRKFHHPPTRRVLIVHEPHPDKTVKPYVLR